MSNNLLRVKISTLITPQTDEPI